MHSKLLLCVGLLFSLGFLRAATPAAPDFILIKGGELRPGLRLDDYEMAAHPITNAE